MIKKLRAKLIVASMFSLTLVLFIILGGVNLMSYQKVISDADAILEVLNRNGGTFPKPQGLLTDSHMDLRPEKPMEERREPGGWGMSPETPYESRYFSVVLDGQGQVIQTETAQIAAVDEQEAAAYAEKVWASGRQSGFAGSYRYMVREEDQGVRLTFLDCSRSLSSFQTTLLASVGLSLAGLTAVFLLLLLLSGRIVRPVAESYEKQKRFITDAGHELKTPLTVISADTDLAEMECGENQWLADIRRQTQRLTGLTNDLIYLSRLEEEQPRLQMIEFPISDVVEEMAQSFSAPAKSQGKRFAVGVQPMLSLNGDEKAVRQLVSILLDNALKYTPEGGEISLKLEKQSRAVALTVSNTTARPMERERLEHLFDRFYRVDQSRSTHTGGYGLGLSIAKGIAETHKGRIKAESPDGTTLTIQAVLGG